MLNQVFKVSSGTCQQFADDAVKISNIFLDFRLSHGSVTTFICGVYIENFIINQLVNNFENLSPHLLKLLTNIK